MSVDIEGMTAFEEDYNKVLDALDQLKAMASPDVADSKAVERWFRDFRLILATLATGQATDRLRRFAEEVAWALGGRGGRPSGAKDESRTWPPPEGPWAKITGGTQAAGWTWTEQEADAAGGSFGDKAGGRTSATDGKAYLTQDIVVVSVNTIVRLFRVTVAGGATEWRFEPPVPLPATQYKQMSVDGDGRWIEDWQRILPNA